MVKATATAIDSMELDFKRSVPRLHFSSSGAAIEIDPLVKRSVFPRDAQQFSQRADDTRFVASSATAPRVKLLLSEAISIGAKEILRANNIAYFDLGGSLFLNAHGLYLFIDKPTPKSIERVGRSLFSGRRAAVLMTLLMSPPRTWFSVNELADAARVSPATTSLTLSELERFQWVITTGKGPGKTRSLQDASGLLDAWTHHTLRNPSVPAACVTVYANDAKAAARRIDILCKSEGSAAAFSHAIAARGYLGRPLVADRLVCYLPSNAACDRVIEQMRSWTDSGKQAVPVEIFMDTTSIGFIPQIDDLTLVNPVQIYFDLMRSNDVDLATVFRQNILRF